MKKHQLPAAIPSAIPPREGVQHARLAITFSKRASVTAEVSVTSGGLLAIGGLVSAILLSTAVLVRSARTRA
jgi:hypothetical protein